MVKCRVDRNLTLKDGGNVGSCNSCSMISIDHCSRMVIEPSWRARTLALDRPTDRPTRIVRILDGHVVSGLPFNSLISSNLLLKDEPIHELMSQMSSEDNERMKGIGKGTSKLQLDAC